MTSLPALRCGVSLLTLLFCAFVASAAPTLETLPIPGDAQFVTVAKDVLDVRFALDPSIAAGAGLFDDAARVPSFAPQAVGSLVARLDADLAALRDMPW